jgi:hypothetical protein
LGKFIGVDPKHLCGPVRKIGKVLVEMDISSGLPETLEIKWRGRKIAQSLDYLGLPFRCNLCHCTGHLRRDCKGKKVEDLSEELELQRSPPAYVDEYPSLHFLDVSTEESSSS